MTKPNYLIHTDAVKVNLIPVELSREQKSFIYADEADLLNVALFGKRAKEWREGNPEAKGIIRDYASTVELAIWSNLVFQYIEFCIKAIMITLVKRHFYINIVLHIHSISIASIHKAVAFFVLVQHGLEFI